MNSIAYNLFKERFQIGKRGDIPESSWDLNRLLESDTLTIELGGIILFSHNLIQIPDTCVHVYVHISSLGGKTELCFAINFFIILQCYAHKYCDISLNNFPFMDESIKVRLKNTYITVFTNYYSG